MWSPTPILEVGFSIRYFSIHGLRVEPDIINIRSMKDDESFQSTGSVWSPTNTVRY